MAPSAKSAKLNTAEPASLLSQWWSIGKIALDRRTKGRHIKVGWVIIERFMRAKGGGRASIRFIQTATGLSSRIVVKACNELVEWGHCSRVVGVGTRPTEYVPSWATVSPMCNARPAEPSASQECNASASLLCNANSDSASPMCSESFLHNRLTKPGYGEEGINDSALPAGSGLSASAEAAPEAAGEDGFQRLWLAYDLRRDKASARAAYNELNPDPVLLEKLVDAATAWRQAAERKPGCKRKYLATWLRDESWDCDVPGSRHSSRQAANDNRAPRGRHTVEIFDSDLTSDDDNNESIGVWFRINDVEHKDTFRLDDESEKVVGPDRRRFDKLCEAIGVEDFEYCDDLKGAIVDVEWTRGGFNYFEAA